MVIELVNVEVALRRHETFGSLLRAIPGLPPEAAVDALIRIPDHGGATRPLLESARTAAGHLDDPIDALLPRPHPLDHEWRFDPETRRDLADELGASAGDEGRILVLGCPTVAIELIARHSCRRVTLVDRNEAMPRLAGGPTFTQVTADLRDGLPADIGLADAAIADPPFYPDHMHAFIAAASTGLRPGSTLRLVLPPATTRPSARDRT